jgi:hypothetical protein
MAHTASLLEDSLAQFLGTGGGGLVRVRLLSARCKRRKTQEKQTSPRKAFHGGSPAQNFTTKQPQCHVLILKHPFSQFERAGFESPIIAAPCSKTGKFWTGEQQISWQQHQTV